MFFLLRMVVWLGLAFLLLPSGANQSVSGTKIAHNATRAMPSDNRSLAVPKRAHLLHPSQDTLTATDVAPAWRGPRGEVHKKNGA
jgi:hypothetical protein